MIHPARITHLNEQNPRGGGYILYWMQASQRTCFNHALEYSIERANAMRLPLLVCFGLMDDYPDANARHCAFMLQGLCDVSEALDERGIQFVVKRGAPPKVAEHYAKDAAMVVCDRGYTRHQKRWRAELADRVKCPAVEVESDVVVPVEVASDKVEFAARTIRPKIHRQLAEFLKPVKQQKLKRSSLGLGISGDVDVRDPQAVLKKLKIDFSVAPSRFFIGGQREAQRLLKEFGLRGLRGYARDRNQPSVDGTSHLSPYLHFGQISPIEIALAARKSGVFVEELIVRRELAVNFVHIHPRYDRFASLPAWAKQTLKQHAKDKRAHLYTRAQLERARTHDRWWNAAQREMTLTGYMHNTMRMYWGKKILEWSRSPEIAFRTALYLNNKYFLDGRDPISYANVAWLFGLHDRPWGRRPIFGTVRYMNAAGLERKFDMEAYAKRIEAI